MQSSNDNFYDEDMELLRKAREILARDITPHQETCTLMSGGICPILRSLGASMTFSAPKVALSS